MRVKRELASRPNYYLTKFGQCALFLRIMYIQYNKSSMFYELLLSRNRRAHQIKSPKIKFYRYSLTTKVLQQIYECDEVFEQCA